MADDASESQPTKFGGLNPAVLLALARNTTLEFGAGARGWTPPTVEELQRALPQYDILALAGRGGMGAVYKGWQKSLDRHVAIKVLPAEVERDEADFAARFKREAKAMARLNHPHIVAVHDAGETPDGLLYFVMDFVEGTDVQKLVAERGRLPLHEALSITTAVCDALAYAHGKGIIHRDIKPSNVMIDPEGNVKVADFGLAKIAGAEASLLTASDVAMGTPDFMAPEARTGSAHVDHRADLYAVGVMLYQMLTGELPHGRFDPPSRIVPGLNKRLDRVVDRALQPQRDARYSSAAELSEDLQPVLSRTIAWRTAATASAQRSWKKLALFGAVAGALAIVAFVVFRPLPPAERRPGSGDMPRSTALPVAAEKPDPAPYPQVDAAGNVIYPVGVWARIWTAEEEARQFAQKDGEWMLLKTKSHGRGSPFAATNAGFRARFRGQRLKADAFPQMNLRSNDKAGSVNLQIVPAGNKLQLRRHLSSLVVLAEVALKEKLSPGPKEYVMEFYAIGTLLVGRVNDQTVAVQMTDPPVAGTLGIHDANMDFIRDVEVLNLDGLPEAEALKLAGIAKPASPAVAAAFPPGQWVKPYADLSKLPNLAEFKDGWALTTSTETDHHVRIPGTKEHLVLHNCGLRVRRQASKQSQPGMLAIRNADSKATRTIELVHQAPDGQRTRGLLQLREFRRELEAPAATDAQKMAAHLVLAQKDIDPIGSEFTTELFAIGNRVVGRINGETLIATVEDGRLTGRLTVFATYKLSFRDLEVINLDGLSEADASELAGIDTP